MSPDITIENIEHDPEDPQSGETVEFRVKVRNNGSEADDSVGVVIYDENDDAVFVPPNFRLNPGEERWTIWTGYSDFDQGTHQLRAEVTDYNEEETFTLSVGGDAGWITGHADTNTDDDPGMRVAVDGNGINKTKLVDSDGSFRFDDLPPGGYDVEVYGSSIDGDSEYVTVDANSETYVSFNVDVETHELQIDSEPIHVNFDGDDEGEYSHLADVRVEAPETEDGYEFSHWESPDGDEIWDDNEYDFTINTDREIIAKYIDPGNPDLQVTEIDTATDEPTEDDTVAFDVTVENTGDVDAENAELRVEPDDGPEFTEYNIDVDAGDEETVYNVGDWEEPDPGWRWVEAEINPDRGIEEEAYDNNEQRDTVEIVELQAPADFTIETITPSPSNPTAGESVDIDVTVSNSGERSVDSVPVTVTVDGTTEEYLVDVPRSGEDTFTIRDVTKQAGDYDVTVTANADENITEQSYDNNTESITLTFTEETVINGRVSFDRIDSGDVTRGGSVTGSVTVENTGNTEHEFFTGFSMRGPDGSMHSNDGSTGRAVTLQPGEERTVSVSWSVPSDAGAGSYDAVTTLWRESDRDALSNDVDSDERRDVVTVPERTYPVNASVEGVTVSSETVDRGGSVTVTGTVQNTSEVERSLTVTARVTDGEEAHDAGSDTVVVAPDETGEVDASWRAPSDASGSYDVEVTVTAPESDANGTIASKTRNDAITVSTPVTGTVTVTRPSPQTLTKPGTVTVTATISNDSPDTAVMYAACVLRPDTGDGSPLTAGVREVRVPSRDSVTESFDVTVGERVTPGSYTPTVTVGLEQPGSGSLTPGNEIASASTDAVNVTAPTADVQVSDVTVGTDTVVAGEAFSVTGTVTNSGVSDADGVTGVILVNGTEETSTSLSLPAGETRSVTADTVTISDVGEADVTVAVRDGAGSVITSETITPEVAAARTPDADVMVTNVTAGTDDVVQGDAVTVTPTIENTGGASYTADVTVTATSETGDFTWSPSDATVTLSPGGETPVDREFPIDTTWRSGSYTVTVTVSVDGAAVATFTREGAFTVTESRSETAELTVQAFTPTYDTVPDAEVTLTGVDVSYSDTHALSSTPTTVGDVPKGTYEYEVVSDAMSQSFTGEFTLYRDVERREIKFDAVTPLTGNVISDDDGQPIKDADVTVTAGEFSDTVSTGELGRFEIPGDVPAQPGEFTVEVNPTTTIERNLHLRDTFTLRANGSGTLPSQDDFTDNPDEIIEELSLRETSPVLSVLLQHTQLKQKLLVAAIGPYMLYGVLGGIFHLIEETFKGLVGTAKAIINIFLNLPEVVTRIFEVAEYIANNHEKVLGYVSNVLHSLDVPDFDKAQREDNPFDEDGDGLEQLKFSSYKAGWYVGYIAAFIASTLSSVKIIAKGKTVIRSIETFEKGISRLESAADKAREITPSANRLQSLRSKEVDIEDAVASGRSLEAVIDAPEGTRELFDDVVTGAYTVNKRTVKPQETRARFLEQARALPPKSLKTQQMVEFDTVYKKQVSDIGSRDVDNAFGGVGEYATVSQMIRDTTGEFKGITENDIYGSLVTQSMTRGDDAIIASVDLQDVTFSDYVKDGMEGEYSLKRVKREIGMDEDQDIQGELDFVRVTAPAETNGRSVVTRVYERKSGRQISADRDTNKKLDHIGKLQALADHPAIDSDKIVNEWGIPLRAFTRARDRDDVDLPNGDALDLKYITASNTEVTDAVDGPFNSDFGDDIPVSGDVITGDYSSSDIDELTEFLLKGTNGEANGVVTSRKSRLEFLFTNQGDAQ